MPAVKATADFTSSNDDLTRDVCMNALRGKVVVFVSPGYRGKRFIFERAFQLGIRSIIIDSRGSWANELLDEGIIDAVLEFDANQSEEVQFSECISQLEELGFQIDGICTFVELSASLAARLAEYFSVPGHSIQSVRIARDKNLTRKAIRSNPTTGQYAIRSSLIESDDISALEKAASLVGFPAVLKPVSGAASLGVQRVNSWSDLVATHSKIRLLLSELVVSNGALARKTRMEDDTEDGESSTNSSFDTHEDMQSSDLAKSGIVLEEYLTGQEVDIDVVLCDGKMTFCQISDNGPTMEPYFGETYNNCPTLLSESIQRELKEMTILTLTDAMGFKDGVFHVEAKYTPSGPRLIEVNCRMGGGPIRAVHLARSNVDLVVEQLLLAIGYPSRPEAIGSDQLCSIGFIEINARKSGSVKSLEFLDLYKRMPGMVYITPYINVGEHIVGPEEGQPSWLAEALFTRSTPEEAATDALRLYEEMQEVFESFYV